MASGCGAWGEGTWTYEITGQVVGGGAGTPLAGATVSAVPPNSDPNEITFRFSTTADDLGNFALEVWYGGNAWVGVIPFGPWTPVGSVVPPALDHLTLEVAFDGRTVRLDLPAAALQQSGTFDSRRVVELGRVHVGLAPGPWKIASERRG
jgi:hypothetical protein